MDNKPPAKTDYRLRRGELSAYGRALASSSRLRLLIIGTGVVLLVLTVVALVTMNPSGLAFLLVVGIATTGLLGLWFIYQYAMRHFVEPDLAVRLWLQQVCDGELNARIGLDESHCHHKELNFHTRNLANSLSRLSNDMHALVESQTERLQRQKSVLELLFKLTSDVSSEAEDERAFVTVCEHLSNWFGTACVGCCRVVETEPVLSWVAIGCSENLDRAAAATGPYVDKSRIITVDQIPTKLETLSTDVPSAVECIWVPFFAGAEPAGVLIIEHNNPALSEDRDTRRVLNSVAEQLGLMCEKQLIQTQMLQTQLSKDRNELAAEIHDSLAQTLLAVRYQTTLLSEKLKLHRDEATYQDVMKISGSIEEANEEIRGLIREYRNPLAEHRSAESLQFVIDQFSQSSGIEVFFQSDDPHIRFTPREESVLQRIISEALNNARKYAQASMIRVFLHCDELGVRRILIEDDGIGFEQLNGSARAKHQVVDSGDHIGLTIMQERGLSVGAKLTIDSEPGEGTRVSIAMPPLIESRRVSA